MMKLSSFKKEIHDLKAHLQKRTQNKFTWRRDLANNLVLQFSPSESIALPFVTLRSYQQEIQQKLFIENYKRFFLV